MPLEIERKFLLAADSWRGDVVHSDRLTDGLLLRSDLGKVRIRLGERGAWLTVKGRRNGISRLELEYEIPRSDALEMLLTLCDGPPLEKVRHTVPYKGFLWSVDEHLGPLEGMTFAEVELERPDQPLPLPDWAGREITHEPGYRKHALMQRCAEAASRA